MKTTATWVTKARKPTVQSAETEALTIRGSFLPSNKPRIESLSMDLCGTRSQVLHTSRERKGKNITGLGRNHLYLILHGII